MAEDRVDFEELNEKDRRRRKRALRRAAKKLLEVFANPRGLERLREITDEEWEAAVVTSGRMDAT